MKKFKAVDIILPVLSLLLICVVATALLALTNKITAPKIAAIDLEAEQQARMVVLPEASSFEDATATLNGTEYTYAKALDAEGEIIGYVFTTSAGGYGGIVNVMTGRDTDGKITGIEVLSCDDETPGLGQNAKKAEWKSQFTGLEGTIELVKGSAVQGSQIQAITSATITSNAVTTSVNLTLDLFNEIMGDESDGK